MNKVYVFLMNVVFLSFAAQAHAVECGEQGFFPSVYPGTVTVPETSFELSQAYPASVSEDADKPWDSIDPYSDPSGYMKAVLDYSLEGNDEVNFRGQDNAVRKWYHAPWLHDDGFVFIPEDLRPNGARLTFNAGREVFHGMTRERTIPKHEIHKNQTKRLSSWAVGMYNEIAAPTFRRVWCTESGDPDPTQAVFEEGAVGFKLLFTSGSVEQIPFLNDTLEWKADIYSCSKWWEQNCWERKEETMRLLQIDITVKDQRAVKTGWFLGTFVYDASVEGETHWDNMVPVGLSWGDDQAVLQDMNRDGAFINDALEESWINPDLIEDPDRAYSNEAYVRFHGLGGRLNGPIDNPISSCMSCHGQAAVTAKGQQMPMANFKLKRQSFPLEEFVKYFSNVPAAVKGRNPARNARRFEGAEYISLDYSLQLAVGIRDYYLDKSGRAEESVQLESLSSASENVSEAVLDAPRQSMTPEQLHRYLKRLEEYPAISRGAVD